MDRVVFYFLTNFVYKAMVLIARSEKAFRIKKEALLCHCF